MPSQPVRDVDPRRVRIGLAFLVAVVVAAVSVAVFVDSPFARLLMGGIIVFTIARTFVLVRSIRQGTDG